MRSKILCGIYCIENIINNKKYIGCAVNINDRWINHRCALRNDRHGNHHLQSAWNKYGEENFKFYILEECEMDVLHDREKYYISLYQSKNNKLGYNKTDGGLGVLGIEFDIKELERRSIEKKNRIVSDITKKRMSDANKRKRIKIDEKEKQRLSLLRKGLPPVNKGVPMTEEHHAKMMEGIKNRSQETREKIKMALLIANLGRKASPETKLKMSESQKRSRAEGKRKSSSEKMAGIKRLKNTSSIYVGVSFDKINNNWRSKIGIGGKSVHLGSFKLELEAAKAYDEKSWELYHNLLKLNFPVDYLDMT